MFKNGDCSDCNYLLRDECVLAETPIKLLSGCPETDRVENRELLIEIRKEIEAAENEVEKLKTLHDQVKARLYKLGY